jgi:ATP-binding cassette subfamily B (MDR/TAP) protein 1
LLTWTRIFRARDLGFRSILRQDISYFDEDVNSTGALTSFLSKGTNDLAGVSGTTLGAILNLVTTIVVAIVLSYIIGWKLALVCSSTTPVLLLCGFSRFWVLSRFEARASKAYQKSAIIACEAVPTIASLTREDDVWNAYHIMLRLLLSKSLRSILKRRLLYAADQSFALLCMGLGLWYGGHLMLESEYDMFQFFVCFSSIIISAQSAGCSSHLHLIWRGVDRQLNSSRIIAIECPWLIPGLKAETRLRVWKEKLSFEMCTLHIHQDEWPSCKV